MKRFCCLMIAFSIVLGAVNVHAIDFKVKGRFVTLFEYGQNASLTKGNGITGYGKHSADEFVAQQRMRVQIDAIASESLSGTVHFEIGQIRWGQASRGGALGADSTEVVKVKHAYINWTMPNTDLHLRMGVQMISTPAHATGSWVYGADTAGITANWRLNENVGLTLFWARPWNDNYSGEYASYMDNMDLFGLSIPLTFDGIKVTPWVVGGAIGPNTFRTDDSDGTSNYFGRTSSYFEDGLVALNYPMDGKYLHGKLTSYATIMWAGIGADVTAFDPFRVAFDFYYGSVAYDDESLNRSGWMALLLAEYKFDWGIPGLVAWYASGDDDDLSNGSERLPYFDRDETGGGSFSNYAFHAGRPSTQRDAVISHNPAGTWGVGLRLRELEMPVKVKHTLRANLIGGTNDPGIVHAVNRKYGIQMTPNNYDGRMLGTEHLYMTKGDYALELGIRSDYKMYENFTIGFDFSYIFAWLDKGVWGDSQMNGKDDTVADSWNASLIFMYNF